MDSYRLVSSSLRHGATANADDFECESARPLEARIEAVLAERKRIAQELHDTLFQDFFFFFFSLRPCSYTWPLINCPRASRRRSKFSTRYS